MNQHKYERIDKGEPRDRAPQPRTEEGTYLPVCTPEERDQIINTALTALKHEGRTTDDIAEQHGIDGSTLRRWLLADDRADKARKYFFNNELSQAREDIRTSGTPFTLARAREDFRAVAFIAERRQAEYSLKQEVKHTGNLGPLISIQLSVTPPPIVVHGDVHTQQGEPITPITHEHEAK